MNNLGLDKKIKELLSNLRVLKRGTSSSPHKYIMLLSIATLLDQNKDHENTFRFNELEPIFVELFCKYFPHSPNYTRMLEYPFYHTRRDKFWHYKIKTGQEQVYTEYEMKRLTKKRILETVEYAYLDSEIFEFLKFERSRSLFICEIENIINNFDTTNYIDSEMSMEALLFEEQTSFFVHEQSAIDMIRKMVIQKKIGQLTSNILLNDKESNNYFEYDLILVSGTGIYVVELKHWTGHIRILPYNWVINEANYRSDPHKINSFKCKILKSIYQHNFRTYPKLWVESIVVLTNPDTIVEGSTSPKVAVESQINNPTFASISDFISYLQKRGETEPKVLNEQQISIIVDFFSKLNQPRQVMKYHLPGYETVEYLFQRPECIELLARPVEGHIRGLNRFRIFRPPVQITREEKERFIKRAYNSLNAVSQIGDHPHISKVWVMKNEDGDIIEGSDWSEAGTLRDLLDEQEGPLSDDALIICQGIAQALHKAHQVGVIHRAVKPENVLMMNGIPKLINFDMSYQIEENRLTVITDVSKIKDDGYIAPEILAGQDIDEGTDYFSLGVIAFELLTGRKPFASTRAFVAQGGSINSEVLQKLQSTGVPGNTIEAIKEMVISERDQRLKSGEKIIEAFSDEDDGNYHMLLPTNVNNKLMPGDLYDVYEILEFIGEGSEAQIYKTRTIRGRILALKLYNIEVSREKIFREAEITSSINSAYVVHCENKLGYWNNERFYLALDYIEGNTMREQIERHEQPDLHIFQKVALGLMEAIKAFHEDRTDDPNLRPIIHGDIKPDNIIITQDGKPVLIDFGIAGKPRVDVFQGTSGYVPPDSILGVDMKFAQEGDLFSLGVTLWEWFFGAKPYRNPTIGETPQITEKQKAALPKHYLDWFLKAVATEADKRFTLVEEMQIAFIMQKTGYDETTRPEANVDIQANPVCIKDEPPDKIPSEEEATARLETQTFNPFVYYLNTLSNVSAGNENATAEAQVMSNHFQHISVPNPLTQFIYEKLLHDRRNIILTGNAGDGKTTIAIYLMEKILGYHRQMKPVESIPEHNLVIIKDMSELTEDERISILLESFHSKNATYLIVSNSGTLLQSCNILNKQNHDMHYDFLESNLLNALASDAPTNIFHDRFLVVNIGNISSINTACGVFKRMLEKHNWAKCSECSLVMDCPILLNVNLLQAKLETVCERVMMVYRRLYEYNVRLTLRQMIGHLAFSITSGQTCAVVNTMSQMAIRSALPHFLFFNLFFGDNGEKVLPLATQLLPVRSIQKSGFGAFLDPLYERRIWMEEETNLLHLMGFPELLTEKLGNFYDRFDHPDSRRQVRRMLFFFGSLEETTGKRFISVFLSSPMLQKYISFCDEIQKVPPLEERKYRIKILHVLQEFFAGMRLPEGQWQSEELYITLSRLAGNSGAQIVLADYRLNDFELAIKTLYHVANESRPVLCLRTKQGNAEMVLDLPFLDYVARRYEGEVVGELPTYYSDRLGRFKIKLLELYNDNNSSKEQHLQLVVSGTERNFRVIKMAIADGYLEVLQ